MDSLGLDLAERGAARAVVVDAAGAVMARAEGADAGDAVHGATSRQAADVGGIASPIDQPDVALAALKTAARCTPGAAAVTAEQWIGAAIGARHAVCLVVGEEVFAGLL